MNITLNAAGTADYAGTPALRPFIAEQSKCFNASDSSSNGIFIPTKTSPELDSFLNNKPSTTTLSKCSLPCQ